jgi:hypothetical protein
MSKLDTLFASYAAHPLVKAGLADIDRNIAANPLVARDGKSAVFDADQYRFFVETEAKREAADKTALLKKQFQGKPTFQQELALLNGKVTGLALLNSINRQPINVGISGPGATFKGEAASTSIAEYWKTTESTIAAMPAEQQKLVREYYELQRAKDKSGDGFLNALKIGILGVAGWALAPVVAGAFKGAVGTAVTTGSNVSTGIQLANYAGEGIKIANLAAPIGTGIKIAPAAFDAALASTSGSLFTGLSKVLDYAKTGSDVFKAGKAVSELVNQPAAQGGGGSEGVINLNLTGGSATNPLGAATNQEVAENLPVSIGGGTDWLPIIIIGGLIYLVVKGQA